MTDADLRELLTEFNELTIALTRDGLELRVAGVPVAAAPTLEELLAGLAPDQVLTAVIEAVNDPVRRPMRPPRAMLIKAAPDVDLYAEWIGSADNVARVGTRAQMVAAGHSEAALARADRYGTSARSFEKVPGYPIPYRDGGWDSSGFVVNNQQGPVDSGWLPREHLTAFLRATAAGENQAAGALLTDD